MLPLPTTRFEVMTWARAKVGRDCDAQVHATPYSIPYRYLGQPLDGHTVHRVRRGTSLAVVTRRVPLHATTDNMKSLPGCAGYNEDRCGTIRRRR